MVCLLVLFDVKRGEVPWIVSLDGGRGRQRREKGMRGLDS